ncbi:MAG: DNA-binding protein [bacterium (Candidatus Stahlbacteria) CG08_land_8_20_14_0_20_40_26]|nr:MAG: DNA-binding protein [bacterium (Candidatus Stahlbacteria) CG08_land_8_20_14_0_20_40_26]
MIDEYIKQWLTKANDDLKIVEHELDLPEKEIVKDAICFHCQQAVEKYLKAFLIYHKAEVERTHDIEHLLDQCALIDKDFVNIEVRELSSFGVDIRYPDDFYIPDMEEVKFYYDLTKRVRGLVLTKLEIREWS